MYLREDWHPTARGDLVRLPLNGALPAEVVVHLAAGRSVPGRTVGVEGLLPGSCPYPLPALLLDYNKSIKQ